MAESMNRSMLHFMVSLYIPGFLINLGFSIVSPILPLYAQSFGVPYALAAMVISANAFARMFADIPLGSICDRVGRRLLIILGPLVVTASAILCGIAQSFPELLVYRVITGFGMAMWMVARQATIADSVPLAIRGRVMSTFQGVSMAGSAAGPAVGGVVAEFWGYRAPFFFYAACTFASLIACVLLVKESASLKKQTERKPTFAADFRVILGSLSFPIVMAMFTTFTNSFRIAARNVLIPLYGNNVLNLTSGEIGLILTVSTVSMILMTFPGGWLVDKYGRKAGLIPAFILTGIVFCLFPLSSDFMSAIFVASILGFASGLGGGASMTLAADLSPEGHKGLFLGFWQTIGDFGMTIGPLTLGFVADLYGLTMPFYVIALLMLFTAGTTQFFVKETLNTAEKS
jgi:DHA1 family multidrug resistance protein-like MFS transporter